MSRRWSPILIAALMPLRALAQATPAPAPPPPAQVAPAPAPAATSAWTANRHVGFFIRPELGFAYLGTSASPGGGAKIELSGGGASFAIAVGGAVTEDFIIAAAVWDYLASSPEVKINGTSYGTANGTSAGLVGYGVMFNWYLMPSNFYLALTPAMTRLISDDGSGSTSTSEWGLGLRAAVGKEWWISDHWGLGLALSGGFSSNKASADAGAPSWGSAAFNLTVSATFN